MNDDNRPITGGVYAAISAVQAELAKTGIAKARRNAQQGYQFRGIDEVYGALAPLLPRFGLVILPRMLRRECAERRSAKDAALFYVTVEAEFDFVYVADGSRHVVRTFGEAMDSGDKATNKAMSAAYKYAAFQAFCVPTEGDNDADATTHDVQAQAPLRLLQRAREASMGGTANYARFWQAITKEERQQLVADHDGLKAAAALVDTTAVPTAVPA
jgi:hypothetical protein